MDPSPEQKGLERDDMIPVASVYPAYVIGNGSRAARELSRTARLGMSLEIAGGAQVTGYRKACPLQPSVCLPFYFFFGYFPVPDSRICCGAPASLSLMVNSPYRFVVLGGVNVTETLQLFPGANVLMHWLLTANGATVVSPVIDMWILDLVELLFVIVTDSAWLRLPTLVFLPNFKDLGLNLSLSGSGVAVAVGVGVTVAVAVAVGVPVAVAVGVTVAVTVAVGETVAVAVAV